jgi:predicted patatin/cPLA2 family phospholipase
MENKDIVIICLIVLVIYLYYQQNNQPNSLGNSEEKIKNLQQQVQHYQTLYQKRVEKDLGLENKEAETQTDPDQLKIQHQEQLRKINVLFDDQAQDYSFIDFNGLYSLLSSIAERERERESKTLRLYFK